ncbi:HNH endonuclease signature motif containing protein [Phocoenobacter skyensis]|uniref:Uncharacterized protein n=1 Tax=Phocoenobacter skyensis TaxID=97481 RepID=A0A1H7XJS3_9PAST|nr:HNH endonuclease signature motif containing protein [Pasteurella skyensis]MDP8184385.1 HNH endonuclease signature motif containing protein [Pasteurella skyensis]QLB22612.1 HNH nuclease [Pasteurella skyensis]SEM34011.1 hypothetical protein SAMN05444853_1139 [Pasteurella skyensis]
MNCKIDGCQRKAMYKSQQVCQLHYFRFMRNGTYDIENKRKARAQNDKGYQMLYLCSHPLAMKGGYVYEHRAVVFDKFGYDLPDCKFCQTKLTWSNVHIDHIDNNIKNNSLENLRPICRGCNVMRKHTKQQKCKYKSNHKITFNGITMTAAEWSRHKGVTVAGNTIIRRLKLGWSVYDALFLKSRTHPNSEITIYEPKYANEFDQNKKRHQARLKLTVDEIKALNQKYRLKIKELERGL